MEYNDDPYDNEVIDIDGDRYYVQGYTDDSEIQMYRPLSALFECEVDYIQTILEGE